MIKVKDLVNVILCLRIGRHASILLHGIGARIVGCHGLLHIPAEIVQHLPQIFGATLNILLLVIRIDS